MKLTLFILPVLFTYSLNAQYVQIDTAKTKFITSSFSSKKYYNASMVNSSELIEQQYFLDLKTTESYLVCEELLDIYERFNKKELNGETLYNYLQERNFLLSWYGCISDVEDQKTKVFKLSKEQLLEILKLK